MPMPPEIPEKLPPTDAEALMRERRREIRAALEDLQVRFIDQKYAGAPEAVQETFAQFLDAETRLIDEVRGAIRIDRKIAPEDDQTPVEDAARSLMADIDELRRVRAPGWSREIVRVLEEARPMIKGVPLEHFGLLEYQASANPKRIEQMAEIGLKPGDEYGEIHFRAPSMSPGEKFGLAELKSSLAKLAVEIVTNAPHVRAVSGKSWLMDTPIAKRLGFREMPSENHRRKGMNYWYQFLDQNGDIDEKRAGKLFEGGKAPYETKLGAMSVEDFLERYLPDELRGKEIMLKVTRPEWKDPEPEIKAAVGRLKNVWPTIADIDAYVQNDHELAALLDRYGLLGEFAADLKEAKKDGLDWDVVRKRPSAIAIGEVLRKRIAEGKYEERKLVIEKRP